MNKFDLEKLGVQEMSTEELINVEGGKNIFRAMVDAVVDAAEWVWECIMNGYKDAQREMPE